MSGKVVGWAFEVGRDRQLPPNQRYVLIAYADNASEKDGKCWPDKPEIVDKTGLSRATVYRAIGELERDALLSFTTDEKGRECLYLAVPWASHGETPESHGETKPSEGLSQRETANSQRETALSHSETGTNKGTVKEPSKETSPASAGPDDSSGDSEEEGSIVNVPTGGRLSNLLADLVKANDPDGVRPKVTKAWLDAERLLVTNDGRDPEVAARLIRWCQADDFWRGNVLSMPKFREKFRTLHAHASRNGKPTGSSGASQRIQDRLSRIA